MFSPNQENNFGAFRLNDFIRFCTEWKKYRKKEVVVLMELNLEVVLFVRIYSPRSDVIALKSYPTTKLLLMQVFSRENQG